MSQESVEIVRRPVRLRCRSRRTLSQRLLLRFPKRVGLYGRLVGRLPPSSRLRQAIVWRSFELATEALNRRDLDAAFIGYRPDREYHPPAQFVAAGFMRPCYRGPEGFRTYMSEWSDVWGRDLRVEAAELIDVGEHLVALGAVPSRAQASGVELSQQWASVFTLKDGQVISQHDYFDHAEALEAVGLSE